MEQIYIDRLTKLANHLLYGKLGHKVFDFDSYNYSEFIEDYKNGCGTSGCAIGECPIVFPKEWVFHWQSFVPLLSKNSTLNIQEDSQTFFGLSSGEYYRLFTPVTFITKDNSHYSYIINGVEFKRLFKDASKEQVSENILKFIKAKKNDK